MRSRRRGRVDDVFAPVIDDILARLRWQAARPVPDDPRASRPRPGSVPLCGQPQEVAQGAAGLADRLRRTRTTTTTHPQARKQTDRGTDGLPADPRPSRCRRGAIAVRRRPAGEQRHVDDEEVHRLRTRRADRPANVQVRRPDDRPERPSSHRRRPVSRSGRPRRTPPTTTGGSMRWRPACASATTRSSISTTSTVRRLADLELPEPPRGVDAGAFYNLSTSATPTRRRRLLSIDKASNNTSIVLLLEWEGWRLLFTGDAEKRSWRTMDKHGLVGPVDFLKVSHHGSDDRDATGRDPRQAAADAGAAARQARPRGGLDLPEHLPGRPRQGRRSTSSASASTCGRPGTWPPASCSSSSGSRRRDPDRQPAPARRPISSRTSGSSGGREAASTFARACSGLAGRRDRGGDTLVGEAPAQEGLRPGGEAGGGQARAGTAGGAARPHRTGA